MCRTVGAPQYAMCHTVGAPHCVMATRHLQFSVQQGCAYNLLQYNLLRCASLGAEYAKIALKSEKLAMENRGQKKRVLEGMLQNISMAPDTCAVNRLGEIDHGTKSGCPK